jgi:tRNA pseudouridine55 synthase
MATGLLVVLIGMRSVWRSTPPATRRNIFLISSSASRRIPTIYGAAHIDAVSPAFTESEFSKALDCFRGDIIQMPPAYSAVKINGRRAYRYAAAGEKIELAPRPVTVSELEVLEGKLPDTARMRAVCSKGTYIRSLCRDIGAALGCGAAMSGLRRIRSGKFRIEDAHALQDIEACARQNEAEKLLLPMENLVMHLKRSDVDENSLRFIAGGNLLLERNMKDGRIGVKDGEETRIYCADKFLALGVGKDGGVKPQKVFYSAPGTNI